ncbi:hypothetical protein M9194_07775 [Vibrio sp. S4M6]|uniref:hypothetical protein n=1 Tax=Vibrio sinus TaxID=2946865 RepID=UPI002029CDEB|nr:hypothetical protein [Vibrio sinus]MCL9781323.1 hypothetical protein [Vibrio sinus]
MPEIQPNHVVATSSSTSVSCSSEAQYGEVTGVTTSNLSISSPRSKQGAIYAPFAAEDIITQALGRNLPRVSKGKELYPLISRSDQDKALLEQHRHEQILDLSKGIQSSDDKINKLVQTTGLTRDEIRQLIGPELFGQGINAVLRLKQQVDVLKRLDIQSNEGQQQLSKLQAGKDKLYIVGHGGAGKNVLAADQACSQGMVTAGDLANQLREGGLPKSFDDIRVTACFSADSKSPESFHPRDLQRAALPTTQGTGFLGLFGPKEVKGEPFAQSLSNKLKSEGFEQPDVTGYHGAGVSLSQEHQHRRIPKSKEQDARSSTVKQHFYPNRFPLLQPSIKNGHQPAELIPETSHDNNVPSKSLSPETKTSSISEPNSSTKSETIPVNSKSAESSSANPSISQVKSSSSETQHSTSVISGFNMAGTTSPVEEKPQKEAGKNITNSLLGEYRFGKYAPSEPIPQGAQVKYTELYTTNEVVKEQAKHSSRTHATSRDPNRRDIVDLLKGTQQADAQLQDVRDAKVGLTGILEKRSAKKEAKQEVREAQQRQGKWERAYTEKYREEIAPHEKRMESAIRQVMDEHGAPIAEKERKAKQNANSLLEDLGYGTYSPSEAVPPEAQELFSRLYEENEVVEKRAHQSARASAIRADKSNIDIDKIREDVKRATANIEAAKGKNDSEEKKGVKKELREAQVRESNWNGRYTEEYETNIATHKKRMDSELKKVMAKYGPPEAEINRVSRKLEEAIAKGQKNVKYYTNPTTGEIRLGGYNGADTEIKGKVEDVLRANPHYPYAKEAREAVSSVSNSLYSASEANLSQYHRDKARQEGEAYYQNQQAMTAARRQADDEAYKARNEADYQQRKAIKEYELAASIAKQEYDAAVREYQKAEKASQSQEAQKVPHSQESREVSSSQGSQKVPPLQETQKASRPPLDVKSLEAQKANLQQQIDNINAIREKVSDAVREKLDNMVMALETQHSNATVLQALVVSHGALAAKNMENIRAMESFNRHSPTFQYDMTKFDTSDGTAKLVTPPHIAEASTSNTARNPGLKLPEAPNMDAGDRIKSGARSKVKAKIPS